MKSKKSRFKLPKPAIFLGIFLITLAAVVGGFWFYGRSTVELQRLGNPLRGDGVEDRALNVWDLQVFDGKIYLGGGSTVANSGPINVWAYNPQSQKFIKEYQVQEEAIEHYRVFEDRLYLPAADPTQGDRHKFYRRHQGKWQQYSDATVELAHVRDLLETETGDILMVGNSRDVNRLESRGTAIASLSPEGLQIKAAGIENAATDGVVVADFNWFFSIFRYQNRIFATNSLLRDADNYSGAIAEYDPQSRQFILNFELRNNEFIPGDYLGENSRYGLNVIYRLWNPVEFQDYLVYPMRSYSVNAKNYKQAYMNSLGLFYKSGMGNSPQPLELPRGEGEDVLVIDNELYVLASRQKRDHKFINYVYKTELLGAKTKWQRVIKFEEWNKARSFEYLDGTFYFGLGQDYEDAVNNSGDILSYTLP